MKNTWRHFFLVLSMLFLLLPLNLTAETSESTPQQDSVVDVDKAAEQTDKIQHKKRTMRFIPQR